MSKRQHRGHRVIKSFGLGAFLTAIAATIYMVWVGVTGQPIPRWFLMLATVF
ncbi:MAG: hypothetical protein J5I81_13480 [Nitrococcus mobilis]|nr:hypothetical protein [Nitrococcus mobilis]